MTSRKPRVLLVAESANPEWVSVPLVGWFCIESLMRAVDGHVVTQIRNREAFERVGWKEGREFSTIDSEIVAKPKHMFETWLRRVTGLGWTVTTALDALPYYLFEQLLWSKFGSRIRAHEFDVVHRVTPLSPTTPSIIAGRCRRAGVPFVWGPINGGVKYPPGFSDVIKDEGEWLSYARGAYRLLPGYRDTRRNAASIIVGSRDTLNELDEYRDRCVYIPENAVDPARFKTVAAPPDEGPLRAVFIGRLVPYKGADMLLEAGADLVRSGKLEIDILGDGLQMPKLRSMVEEKQLGKGVRLAGWVDHKEIEHHMQRSHVLAFPSIREFGGGVVLEAMMMGITPIVVDYAGPAELVTEQTGFRVPVGSRAQIVDAFRKVLADLCEDRSRLKELSANSRKRVLDWFTWDAKAAQIAQVYHWVLGAGPKPFFGIPFRESLEAPSASE